MEAGEGSRMGAVRFALTQVIVVQDFSILNFSVPTSQFYK